MKDNIQYYKCYVYHLGLAVYTFSYYETLIIDICAVLDQNFRDKYYRKKSMTSGFLNKELNDLIKTSPKDNRDALFVMSQDFRALIEKRNALIHAHPIYGNILNYQTNVEKIGINDYTWSLKDIEYFIDVLGTKIYEAASLKALLENK